MHVAFIIVLVLLGIWILGGAFLGLLGTLLEAAGNAPFAIQAFLAIWLLYWCYCKTESSIKNRPSGMPVLATGWMIALGGLVIFIATVSTMIYFTSELVDWGYLELLAVAFGPAGTWIVFMVEEREKWIPVHYDNEYPNKEYELDWSDAKKPDDFNRFDD